MAIGRIPGPIGDVIGVKVVQAPGALGSTGPLKKVPVGIDARILFPPPRLVQTDVYKGTEGLFGCWATVAEMIIKHRDSDARFERPVFEHLLSDVTFEGKVRYMNFVDNRLAGFGFRRLPGGMLFEWEISTVASSVNVKGPLLCMGKFFEGPVKNSLQIGGDMHCIAVFGGQDGLVYYRDPMDGVIKKMSIAEFNVKGRLDAFKRAGNILTLG